MASGSVSMLHLIARIDRRRSILVLCYYYIIKSFVLAFVLVQPDTLAKLLSSWKSGGALLFLFAI